MSAVGVLRALAARAKPQAGRVAVIGLPYLWLGLFFLLPVLIILKISLASSTGESPPYTALWDWSEQGWLTLKLNFGNFLFLGSDDLYLFAYINSVRTALICTILCLLIGYPMAYAIARAPTHWRPALLMMVILPFWTSFLIRIYAWMGILNDNGLLNSFLLALGVISEPINMINTPFAVYVGIVYAYLPFMVLPLYSNLEKMDVSLLEAAADLGCRPMRAFVLITLPLSLPGIIAGSMLVFIPAVGEFVIPELLGGTETLMIGSVLWNEFFNNRDWPVAASVAMAMLVLLVAPIMVFQHVQGVRATHGGH